MKYKPYPNYKDSGVEWLGEIPEGWEHIRLRFLFEIKKRIAGIEGYDVLSITQKGIKIKDTQSNEGQISEDYSKYQLVNIGDFAMNHMDLLTGFVDIAKYSGVTSPDYRVFSLRHVSQHFPRYFLYLFQMCYVQKIFYPYGQGSSQLGRWRLPTEAFQNFWFPLPSQETQKSIASFLDATTARIDSLVLEYESIISLLQEKRQALISHAVTRGLSELVEPDDPEFGEWAKPVKFVDSGVEWLGEMPEGWIVTRLSRFATVENGTTPSRSDPAFWASGDDGIPWLGSGEVNQYSVFSCTEYITPLALENCSLRLLPIGTIIVGIVGEGKTRGTSARLCIEATINQNLAAIIPFSSLDSDFLHFVLQSAYDYLRDQGRGGNQSALNCEIIAAFKIPVPGLKEQETISTYLKRETSKLDALVAEAGGAIELLKERRSALITAAVTGKINVEG